MPDTAKIVLLAGATGLIGSHCLRLLAEDPGVREVRALTRRPLKNLAGGGKVRACMVDFDHLDRHAGEFDADAVICALGTTLRAAGSRPAFRRVDHDYPLALARAARARGARHFLLVSAAGADPRSMIFYNRVKGELEQALRALDFPSLTIVRPSLLLGERSEHRPGEEWAKRFGWLLPSPWKPIEAAAVAAALVRAMHAAAPGVAILENRALRQSAQRL
ncbi:Uncharacterized conserved protein YbjT, contains NAD(P)-binding and DUF2867 domains [Noviherbaspirillum humi]|uniref:Uncharacterized conserved protein YbjT, contains NAD(P)-binding and DUF2867 domains n=1 Tax=Noviherbaspirillum humi TaxID=1688639 RepID=A0A239CCQ8_9BURK|nr:NAD(P)H-binding protein [Noviherbaspirillum humi]SNS18005.1 Uncharacterized conserved protein YbjT, contains NAD(P)-binding and DUF2867 domains [Noviherbaspirillum humi]